MYDKALCLLSNDHIFLTIRYPDWLPLDTGGGHTFHHTGLGINCPLAFIIMSYIVSLTTNMGIHKTPHIRIRGDNKDYKIQGGIFESGCENMNLRLDKFMPAYKMQNLKQC